MVENLLLTNLFLISNSLITLAFVLYGWLYMDLYVQSKKSYALSIGIGGWIMALAFISSIFFELFQIGSLKEYIFIFLQFIGLFSIAYGYGKEIIPGLPKSKSSKVNVLLTPFIAVFTCIANFILATFITTKILHKVNFGRAKEFRPLIFFWIIISFILLLNVVAFLGNDRFPFLEINLMRFSFAWVFVQILLLLCFVLMYRWIKLFLSFRNFTKILFDIWSFSIVLCLVITTVFTVINVSNYERHIISVLENNGRMVEFNVDQIKDVNIEVLDTVSSDDLIIEGILSRDSNLLESELKFLTFRNFNIDTIGVVDTSKRILYNSERVESIGNIISGNVILDNVISSKSVEFGYWVKDRGTIAETLVYQVAVPVFLDNSFVGVVYAYKGIDQDFLNYLNSYTGQEFIMVNRDGGILASVLDGELEFDGIFRVVKFRDVDGYHAMSIEINNRPYLGFVIEFDDEAHLGILTSYDLVSTIAQNSMYLISFYSVLISLFSVIPSYYLAKKIKRDSA